MTDTKVAIGVDIGGSHISCAAIDLINRTLIRKSYSENEVDNRGSKIQIIHAWAEALRKTLQNFQMQTIVGIGFAMPGPFNYETGEALFERVEKYENLYGVNIVDEIHETLHLQKDIPIRFMNDATSFAVGEAWMGKTSSVSRSLAITLGTGFGSAFIKDGIPVVKGNTVPELGCVWHLPFKGGIADDFISTRWFVKSYWERTGREVAGVKEIAEMTSGDPEAGNLFETFGKNMGIILAPWLKKFEAEMLVMGGNIAASYALFGPYFEEILDQEGVRIRIERSDLKEYAAMIGSARLLDPGFFNHVKPLLKYM